MQFVKVAERLEPEPLPRFSNKDLSEELDRKR